MIFILNVYIHSDSTDIYINQIFAVPPLSNHMCLVQRSV